MCVKRSPDEEDRADRDRPRPAPDRREQEEGDDEQVGRRQRAEERPDQTPQRRVLVAGVEDPVLGQPAETPVRETELLARTSPARPTHATTASGTR